VLLMVASYQFAAGALLSGRVRIGPTQEDSGPAYVQYLQRCLFMPSLVFGRVWKALLWFLRCEQEVPLVIWIYELGYGRGIGHLNVADGMDVCSL